MLVVPFFLSQPLLTDILNELCTLRRAISSILNMALHFSEGFLSFGGDTTTNFASVINNEKTS